MKLFKKIFLIFLIIFLISSLINNFRQYQKSLNFYQQFKNEYEKEKYKNIKLKTEIIRKKSLFEIEKIIRNQLNLSKMEEYIIIIPTPSIAPSPTQPTIIPNCLKWWQVFAKNN